MLVHGRLVASSALLLRDEVFHNLGATDGRRMENGQVEVRLEGR